MSWVPKLILETTKFGFGYFFKSSARMFNWTVGGKLRIRKCRALNRS